MKKILFIIGLCLIGAIGWSQTNTPTFTPTVTPTPSDTPTKTPTPFTAFPATIRETATPGGEYEPLILRPQGGGDHYISVPVGADKIVIESSEGGELRLKDTDVTRYFVIEVVGNFAYFRADDDTAGNSGTITYDLVNSRWGFGDSAPEIVWHFGENVKFEDGVTTSPLTTWESASDDFFRISQADSGNTSLETESTNTSGIVFRRTTRGANGANNDRFDFTIQMEDAAGTGNNSVGIQRHQLTAAAAGSEDFDFIWYTAQGGSNIEMMRLDGSAQIISMGVNDSNRGDLYLYGDTTGTNIGAEIRLYSAADHDAVFSYYKLGVNQDDLRIGPSNNEDNFLMQDDGDIVVENDFTVQKDIYGDIVSYTLTSTPGALSSSEVFFDIGQITMIENQRGFGLSRTGSFIGYNLTYDVSADAAGTVELRIMRGTTTIYTAGIDEAVANGKNSVNTQARDSDTVGTSDIITASLAETAAGSTTIDSAILVLDFVRD